MVIRDVNTPPKTFKTNQLNLAPVKITKSVFLVGDGARGISHALDCCVYLLNCGSKWLMIDAGGGSGGETIVSNMREDGVMPQDIDYIALTHAHADHACGAKFFKDRFGTKILASETDSKAIESGTDEELGLNIARGSIYPSDFQYIHCEVDKSVKDGEEIQVGERTLKFIVIPGHTPGAMCILDKRERILFPGDVVFFNGTIGLGNWPGSDLSVYRNHIGKLSGLGVEQLFPGHFMFTIRGGQSHLDKAVANLKMPSVPPVWGHNHPAT
jgi:hydroxyacylglutathione hydrolase